MNNQNYNHLFYFYVIAKLGGYTLASKHLNTSQSSLSLQIKTLEETLGIKLFKKVGRNISLTGPGKEIFHYCRRSFEIFDEMFDQLEKRKTAMGVRISIGVSDELERLFITEALSNVSKAYPKAQRPLLHFLSLPSSQLFHLLKLGEIDLLITNHAVLNEEMEIHGQFNLPVAILIAAELLKAQGRKSIETLIRKNEMPFVFPSKITSLRQDIDHYFARKKLNPVCVFESNILSSVMRALYEGMGASILPEAYLDKELKLKKIVRLNSKPMWEHKMYLISAREGQDEARTIFAQKLAKQFQSLKGIE
jgi:LysR family transcriptional activator of nhaA